MGEGQLGNLFDMDMDGKLNGLEQGMEMAFLDFSAKKYGDGDIHLENLFGDIDEMMGGGSEGNGNDSP